MIELNVEGLAGDKNNGTSIQIPPDRNARMEVISLYLRKSVYVQEAFNDVQ